MSASAENREILLARAGQIFETLVEPKLKWSLKTLGLVRKLDLDDDGNFSVTVNLITEDEAEIATLKSQLEAAFAAADLSLISLEIGRVNIATHGIDGVRHMILVGSGKGGVGKSSIAANLAVGLAEKGHRVGLMDADIFGPSLPAMMGGSGRPEVLGEENLMPLQAHGVKIMSLGFLIDKDAAVEWRGVVAAGTLLQFIRKTLWGDLDYLIVDMPPGSGDIHLTIAHDLKVSGAVVVTTPQEVVLGDVRRSLDLFAKCQIPVLGLVENMSYMTCCHCGGHNEPFHRSEIGLGEDVQWLARLPLSPLLSKGGDCGRPAIITADLPDNLRDPLWGMVDNVEKALATPVLAEAI